MILHTSLIYMCCILQTKAYKDFATTNKKLNGFCLCMKKNPNLLHVIWNGQFMLQFVKV